ncbi:MAG TPA: hypothetical protein PKY01_21045, partial [Candidatus Hydrogenedentes bacterium]|nr:hypothetical protein [Candidatus Hydrogenedentota bacterium]
QGPDDQGDVDKGHGCTSHFLHFASASHSSDRMGMVPSLVVFLALSALACLALHAFSLIRHR